MSKKIPLEITGLEEASMSNVLEFSEKATTCYAWTVEQMLDAALEDIRTGKIKPSKAMFIFFETTPNNDLIEGMWRAQIDRAEEIALMELVKQKSINRWRGLEP